MNTVNITFIQNVSIFLLKYLTNHRNIDEKNLRIHLL